MAVHFQLSVCEYVIFIDQTKIGRLPIVFVFVSSFPDSWLRSFIPVIIHVYYYSSMISWSPTSDDLCRPTPSNQVQSHSYSESVLSLAQNPNHHIKSKSLAPCQPIRSQLLAHCQPIRTQVLWLRMNMRDYRLRNGVSGMRLREENGKMLSMTGNISKYGHQSMTLVCGMLTTFPLHYH